MIKSILANNILVNHFKHEIKENGVSVKIDKEFYLDDSKLNLECLVNISIDEFYNSQRMRQTPPSIDNLLVIDRGNKRFSLYLIELKDVSTLDYLSFENIRGKFETTINDFMANRFKNEFYISDTKISDFNIWLVCNQFEFLGKKMTDEDYEKRVKNTIIEKLLLIPPFKFRGKLAMLQAMHDNIVIC